MILRMQPVHFDADQKLLDYVQKKVDKLETFHDRIIDGEVIMRLEKSHLNKKEVFGNKTVELRINIPRQQLFVKDFSNTFESAIDQALERMSRQLKREKEKRQPRKVNTNLK
ncbi:MAG: ribosome-associated translation inhibitor RaiA [Bacteroidetes bacterium]|nr:ribosome-associated translation inhibitor RaiA [Bacteroidota bacterium]